MNRWEEIKGKHKGEEAWIFGKGPGLDYYDFADAGPLRFGINLMCHIVPNCTYGIHLDPGNHDYTMPAPPHVWPFVSNQLIDWAKKNNEPWLDGRYTVLTRKKDYDCNKGRGFVGIQVATWLMCEAGVSKIHYIGCGGVKGIEGYAKLVWDYVEKRGLSDWHNKTCKMNRYKGWYPTVVETLKRYNMPHDFFISDQIR